MSPPHLHSELHWLEGGCLGGWGGQDLELHYHLTWVEVHCPLETAWIMKWEWLSWSTVVSLEEKHKYKIKMEIHRTGLWSHAVWISILPCYKQSEFVQFLLYCFVGTFLPKNKLMVFLSPHVHYLNDLNAENKIEITSVYNRLSGSILRAETKQGNS